jgi:hypothetical protein
MVFLVVRDWTSVSRDEEVLKAKLFQLCEEIIGNHKRSLRLRSGIPRNR